MKNILLLVFLVLCTSIISAQNHSAGTHNKGGEHLMMNTSDIKFMDGPATLPLGSQFVVLQGDPAKEGPFTLRVSFPANYKVPPHWHPTTENVVVLEGTLYMGSGEKLNETNATALAPGGFSSIPAKSPHYVFTKEKCVIQLHATGPFAITYINPADDPRNK